MAPPAVNPPAKLPANFDGWDQSSSGPPSTLPADFNGWDQKTRATTESPKTTSLLDTLRSNWHSNVDPVPSSQAGSFAHNVGGAAAQAVTAPLSMLEHPVGTIMGGINTLIHPINTASGIIQNVHDSYKSDPAQFGERALGNILAGVVSGGLGGAAGEALTPLAKSLQPRLETVAGKMVDRAAGSREADFKRGAKPGLSYLQGGGKPALTMNSLSEKAYDVANNAGAAKRPMLMASTRTISPSDVADAAFTPIQELRDMQTGFGGAGISPSVEGYEDHLLPSLQSAYAKGTLSPLDVYDDFQHKISKATNWKDQSMYDLNKVRQNTYGKLGDLITDAVPETKPLNKIYQGSINLAERTGKRANTGSAPLTKIATRLALGGLGHDTFGAAGTLLGALPTTPVLTSGGYGLYRGAQMLPSIGRILPAAATAATAVGVAAKKKNKGADSE